MQVIIVLTMVFQRKISTRYIIYNRGMQLVDLNGRYGTISVVKNNVRRAVCTSLRRDDVAAVIADKHDAELCTNKKGRTVRASL
jgi:hypothetical protein